MRRIVQLILVALLLTLPFALVAQERVLAIELGPVQQLLSDRCSVCHLWASSAEGILERVTPGNPEQSALFTMVSAGEMPPDGRLSEEEQRLLRDWITAGAPTSATEAATSPAPTASSQFLGFPSKVAFHEVSGFTSAALFTAAGVLGAIQWATLISASHAYREANGIDEDTMSPQCNNYIQGIWADPFHQSLRWTHVGLLSAGELLYLANAVTGITLLTPDRPGLTPADLHRYAFFTHGTLMISQFVLGIFTTTLLSQGNHWTMIAVGAAHTVIGIAIPLIVTGAGLAVMAGFP